MPRTTHARVDPVTPQVGLFRAESSNPKDRPPPPKDGIVYQQNHDGMTIEFRAAGQMDATDWRHFLAIAALAGLDGDRFNGESDVPPLPTLWDRFLNEGVALRKDGLRLRTTAYAILREAGLADFGQNRKRLTTTLHRLAMIRQFLRKGNRAMSGANLLSFAHDEDSGELSIGLSPQMARTILGESKQVRPHQSGGRAHATGLGSRHPARSAVGQAPSRGQASGGLPHRHPGDGGLRADRKRQHATEPTPEDPVCSRRSGSAAAVARRGPRGQGVHLAR